MNTNSTAVRAPGQGEPGATGRALLVVSEDSFTTLWLPRDGVVLVGRSSSCDIQLQDPQSSREHLRLHLQGEESFAQDLNSANGTTIRDRTIDPGALIPLAYGEPIVIGATVLMLQKDAHASAARRVCSHAQFEQRLQAECQASKEARTSFSVARLQLKHPEPWTKVAQVFSRRIAAPHVLAAYAPHDYEILLLGTEPDAARALITELRSDFESLKVPVNGTIVDFPADGASGPALTDRLNQLLRNPAVGQRESIVVVRSGAQIERVYALAARAAASSINVLIMGETGCGKEVLARRIHAESRRAEKAFVALNCAALPDALVDSELFGFERGAFTNADHAKPGLLEEAHGSTLFLDEVGELQPSAQAKLLRVLETGELRRIGALKHRTVNVRVISATNRKLEQEVAAGNFREDLFYRLNGFTLEVPPLRSRVAEVVPLAREFLATAWQGERPREAPEIDAEACALLERHPWPGNVRELKNVIERAAVLCTGDEIRPEHLALDSSRSVELRAGSSPPGPADERGRILDALAQCNGNQTRAAELLGMPRRTFVAKLDKYGISRPQKGNPRK